MLMNKFREDMIRLSKIYPFITKVTISEEAWQQMCQSFDTLLKEEAGHTAAHIKDKNGSMRFENLFVESNNDAI